MLKPAQMYKERLQEENIKSWYKPENIYWEDGVGNCYIDIDEDNYNKHQFVSVDKNDNIIGYIKYSINWPAMSAYGFSVISFDKGNVRLIKDLYKAICDLFGIYNMNRIEWVAYADNPAVKAYRNFIKRHGGSECGYRRQVAMLQDGKLHDMVTFEVTAEEFKQ